MFVCVCVSDGVQMVVLVQMWLTHTYPVESNMLLKGNEGVLYTHVL